MSISSNIDISPLEGPTPALFEAPKPVLDKRSPNVQEEQKGKRFLADTKGGIFSSMDLEPNDKLTDELISQSSIEGKRRNSEKIQSLVLEDLENLYNNHAKKDNLLMRLQSGDDLQEDWDQNTNTLAAFMSLRRHFLIRNILLRMIYPLPSVWKNIAAGCNMAIICVCALAILAYGLRFESTYSATVPQSLLEEQNQCANAISYKSREEYAISVVHAAHWSQDVPLLPAWSFPDDWLLSTRWIVLNFLVLIQTLFMSQPLNLFLEVVLFFLIVPSVQNCMGWSSEELKHHKEGLYSFFKGNVYKINGMTIRTFRSRVFATFTEMLTPSSWREGGNTESITEVPGSQERISTPTNFRFESPNSNTTTLEGRGDPSFRTNSSRGNFTPSKRELSNSIFISDAFANNVG